VNGTGPFSILGEAVYDDYWMYYLTKDMAKALEIERPYTSIKSYLEYKKKGITQLTEHADEIKRLGEDESGEEEDT